ncbi:MAG: hypothetical protein LBV32_01995 [Tannerellaceae bacterium]|jgi:predicted histone-like DNA-binding protein|nr:hypothetical protein [Tannerellaceae bacterium]
MALAFSKVKRKVLNGPEAGQERYYAVAKATGITRLEEMCELIGARSTGSSADVKGVLDSLNWAMALELKAGRVVQLGELGNFRLSISSKGSLTEEEVTSDRVTGTRILFSPGSVLRYAQSQTVFTPIRVVEKIIYKDQEKETPEGEI